MSCLCRHQFAFLLLFLWIKKFKSKVLVKRKNADVIMLGIGKFSSIWIAPFCILSSNVRACLFHHINPLSGILSCNFFSKLSFIFLTLFVCFGTQSFEFVFLMCLNFCLVIKQASVNLKGLKSCKISSLTTWNEIR